MPGKFQLKKAKNGQFYFNLLAGNGEVILTSEMYKAKPSAKNGIASVMKNAPDSAKYENRTAKNGKFFFVLKAANSQVIGNSEMYDSEKSCANGVQSVTRNAPGAKVEDLSVAAKTMAAGR
jgi:uncharacterized protein YegP (UPF0339 family)